MQSELTVENYYRVPGGVAAVRRVGNDLVRIDTDERAGAVHQSERRFEWQSGAPAALTERIASEQALWDGWADAEVEALRAIAPLDPESRRGKWWDYSLYDEPGVARTILETPELQSMRKLRILDVGGSVKDSWRFVWHGENCRVDQVDVSGETQRFGYLKLQARFRTCPELLESFTFHTAAAEALPFADESFDLVFSRATIHHTSRSHSFAEIHRVLRPDGVFWMIEPRMPAPVYRLMKLFRKLRRADRGTDDPLRNFELRRLGELLPVERVYGIRLLAPYATFVGAGYLSTVRNRIEELDRSLVTGWFGRRLAHTISLVARKPR